MKWVKHMTNTSQDPKIQMLRAEFGNEGYAVYWLILEKIAAEYTKLNPAVGVCLPIKTWRKITEISEKKLKKILFFSKKISLLDFEISESEIAINFPKLLKYSDEYSQRKGSNETAEPAENREFVPIRYARLTSTSPFPRDNSTQVTTEYLGAGAGESDGIVVPFRVSGGDA
jgi:hypothetical protein